MIVRTMRPEEIDLNINLFRQFVGEVNDYRHQFDYDEDSVIQYIRNHHIKPELCWFSLMENSRPIGFICGAISPVPWNWEYIDAHIEVMWVLKEKRTDDANRRLLEAFEDWALSMDAVRITGNDYFDNHTDFKNQGFKQESFVSREIR